MKLTKLQERLLTCAVAALCVAALYLLKIPCLFKWALGIACPGCGMTRAWLRLLQLDFAGAFSLHPLFWAAPILFLVYVLDGTVLKGKWLSNLLYGLLFAGFLAVWIVRLATGTSLQ